MMTGKQIGEMALVGLGLSIVNEVILEGLNQIGRDNEKLDRMRIQACRLKKQNDELEIKVLQQKQDWLKEQLGGDNHV